MTIGYVAIYWGLPIATVCGSAIGLNHYGLVYILRAASGALWAAARAIELARREYRAEYGRFMEGL